MAEAITIGKRGTLVIPAGLRRKHRLGEGELVLLEEVEGGILLRPAVAVPRADTKTVVVQTATEGDLEEAKRLLEGATTLPEYLEALDAVRELGLDPDVVPHSQPDSDRS